MMEIIIKELFYVLNGALIIFMIMETIWPGIVLAYINLNLILLFCLVIGIVIVIFMTKKKTKIITDNEQG